MKRIRAGFLLFVWLGQFASPLAFARNSTGKAEQPTNLDPAKAAEVAARAAAVPPAQVDVDSEALCGAKPPAGTDQTDQLKKIEKDMPPVQNQNRADWCYAFSASDILDYQIHMTKVRTGAPEPYSDANMVSPIDMVSAQRLYLDQHSNVPVANPGELNTSRGGASFDVFLGVQNLGGKVRSMAQIPFQPLDLNSDRAQKLAADFMKEYPDLQAAHVEDFNQLTGCYSPSDLFRTEPAFKKMLYGFRPMNEWLYQGATQGGDLSADGKILDHYQDLALAKGAPDLQIPPIVPNDFWTTSTSKFLGKIHEVLSTGQPMSTPVCVHDIEKDKNEKDPCGSHVMTIVGSGYVDGVCKIRLRNSWGKGWRDGGYTTLSVEEYLQAAKDQAKVGATDGTENLVLTWLTDEDPNAPAPVAGKRQKVENDNSVFLGTIVKTTRNDEPVHADGTYPSTLKYWTGTFSSKVSSRQETSENGLLVHVENAESKDDGGLNRVFSGDVTQTVHAGPWNFKTGVSKYDDGSSITYVDGKSSVFSNNAIWNPDKGTHFTGTAADGSPKDGTLIYKDGSSVRYDGGVRVEYKGAIWNQTTGSRLTGTITPDNKVIDGTVTFPDGGTIVSKAGAEVQYDNAIWNNINQTRFTGEVRNDSFYTGSLKYPDGSEQVYKDGKRDVGTFFGKDGAAFHYSGGMIDSVTNVVLFSGEKFTGKVYGKPDGTFTTTPPAPKTD